MIYYLENSGHASLCLTGLGERNIHISVFAPVGAAEGTQGLRLHQLRWDIDNEAHRIETVIAIPSKESCGLGLSEQAIFDWWKKIDADRFQFDLQRNNCRKMVYRALTVGCQGLDVRPILSKKDIESLSAYLQRQIADNKVMNRISENLKVLGDHLKHVLSGEIFIEHFGIVIILLNELNNDVEKIRMQHPQLISLLNKITEQVCCILTQGLKISGNGKLIASIGLSQQVNEKESCKKFSDWLSKNKFKLPRARLSQAIQEKLSQLASLCYLVLGGQLSDIQLTMAHPLAQSLIESIHEENNPQKACFYSRHTSLAHLRM